MRRTPNIPIVGEGLSANFARDIIRELRASRIIAGNNITVDYTPNGTRINGTPGSAASYAAKGALMPFTVRWLSHDDDPDNPDPGNGEWQIYVPFGSMVVYYGNESSSSRRYAALPTNEDGTDADGKTTYQWYKIPEPDDSDAIITTLEGMVAKAWTVYLLTKPWARFKATTDPKGNGAVAWTDAVATIGISEYTDKDGDRHVNHVSAPLKTGAIIKTWDNTGAFAIDYELDDETDKDSTYTAKVINQTKMFGRLQVKNAEPVDVSEAEEVWIEIDHSGEEFDFEVKTSVSDEDSNDDKTVFRIYEMDDGVVIRDYRGEIPETPFYTNAASSSASQPAQG